MMDKKITDEEIKSSLEVIATTRNCNECKIRNCKWGTCNCSQITANVALDLINRQKAEIERLGKRISGQKHALFKQQAYTAELQNEIVKLKDYNENLLAANTVLSNQVLESKAKAKAEAYKEFAEKAKENFQNLEYSADTDRKTVKVEEMKEQINWVLHSVAAETLDNILEELVGETDD